MGKTDSGISNLSISKEELKQLLKENLKVEIEFKRQHIEEYTMMRILFDGELISENCIYSNIAEF